MSAVFGPVSAVRTRHCADHRLGVRRGSYLYPAPRRRNRRIAAGAVAPGTVRSVTNAGRITEPVACVTRRRKGRRRPGCPLGEEVGSGRCCPGCTLAAWMAPDCGRRCRGCLTCQRVQLGAVAEPQLGRSDYADRGAEPQLDRSDPADRSDDAAGTGRVDGQGHARARGGRVGALASR